MLKKLTLKETIIYIASIVIAITGLVFILLGIIGSYVPVTSSLAKAQAAFSWRWVGLIILSVGILLALITLLVTAKKTDRITEREIRRKQRLSAMMSDVEKKEETIVINKEEIDKSATDVANMNKENR